MEKRKPHYDLNKFKELFCSVETRFITAAARKGAVTMGYMDEEGIIAVINRLCSEHFYKSMTTHVNHKIWQDVYRYQDDEDNDLYISCSYPRIKLEPS
ncbi:type II toxin-antitoxin system MqsR family toxin [Desulfobacterium sp. N47]|uniref:Motility quorum-sensing regulator mqsR n=1 Tax=uncultured Desulfobacterium sp. TaxID=201089 RepID=E1YKP6_9BACT|nr:Motility quorum-sensing regulator mqsR [uncultured Desulfobacterium sp.]